MRTFILIFTFINTASCFDLKSIDTDIADWRPTNSSNADIIIDVKSSVTGLFKREDSFPYSYAGSAFDKLEDGTIVRNVFTGGNRTIPYFEKNGNRGWLYIRDISDKGAHVRCVVREAADDGKILYEREFVIPWSSKTFSLQTDKEDFIAEIRISNNQTK